MSFVSAEEQQSLREAVQLAEEGHPKYRRAQWILRAYRLRNEWRLAESIAAWYAAIEAHCYQLLELLLVDEGVSETLIRDTLDRLEHIRAVLPELQRRLGGSADEWRWSGDGVVGQLHARLYVKRNAISHRNEQATPDDYDRAERALKAFVDFTDSRLRVPNVVKTYPRTALLMVGLERLSEVVGRETRATLERLDSSDAVWKPSRST
jgi:hypothetical protein